MIRSQFKNFQRQRMKSGGRRTPGMLSRSTLERGLAGDIIPHRAPKVMERDDGFVVRESQ